MGNIQHRQVRFIPVLPRWYHIHESINMIHHINERKNKNHMNVSVDEGKALDKLQQPFFIKTFNKVGI